MRLGLGRVCKRQQEESEVGAGDRVQSESGLNHAVGDDGECGGHVLDNIGWDGICKFRENSVISLIGKKLSGYLMF